MSSTRERHPRELYVLFAAEMWERFSFNAMLSMFTLYLQDPTDGFGWSKADATGLYSTYISLVFVSPVVGGWIADRALGFRRAAMLGGVFFVAGHLLLAVSSIAAVYAALACLVIGNGFFKPNISTMVGNLYPPGSPLKGGAFSLFYMGINTGAFGGALMAEFVKRSFGVHAAFVVAGAGMIVSVLILWAFRRRLEKAPPTLQPRGPNPLDAIPDRTRIGALCVVYLMVVVFWMIFLQSGSTLTYFADENTRWDVSGTISNAINPGFVILLTFPLLWCWRWLAARGREPSAPAKMALGMLLTAIACVIMAAAGRAGGDEGRVSPAWLLAAYGVLTLGELMLSPVGLTLVNKVAPARHRGLMMGCWFLATGIGNKLTVIGVYWDEWRHSTFFALLAGLALAMAAMLTLLVRRLARAMPGV